MLKESGVETARQIADFIDHQEVEEILARSTPPTPSRVRELLAKAQELSGLSISEVASLSFVKDPELLAEIFSAAKKIKEEIYGSRLVLFAPLYISNRCANECTYCAFRATNTGTEAAHPHPAGDRRGDADHHWTGAQADSHGRRRGVSRRDSNTSSTAIATIYATKVR